MRYKFEEIFKQNEDGVTWSPMRRIRVGSVIFGPEIKMTKGVAFGGVDFLDDQFKGHELRAEQDEDDEDLLVITGIY